MKKQGSCLHGSVEHTTTVHAKSTMMRRTISAPIQGQAARETASNLKPAR